MCLETTLYSGIAYIIQKIVLTLGQRKQNDWAENDLCDLANRVGAQNHVINTVIDQ